MVCSELVIAPVFVYEFNKAREWGFRNLHYRRPTFKFLHRKKRIKCTLRLPSSFKFPIKECLISKSELTKNMFVRLHDTVLTYLTCDRHLSTSGLLVRSSFLNFILRSCLERLLNTFSIIEKSVPKTLRALKNRTVSLKRNLRINFFRVKL